jgi:hypothetical protein
MLLRVRGVHIMSDVVFEDVLALALQLPFDDQRRLEARLAQEREQRVQEFQQSAKEIGLAFEQLGLNEEELDAELEAVRQEIYEEQHGRRA